MNDSSAPVRALIGVLGLALLVSGLGAPTPAAAVIGGQDVAPGDLPSVVALVRSNDPDAVRGQFCAGTAIAEDLVLTAAHCFHTRDGSLSRAPADVQVVAGHRDLSPPDVSRAQGMDLYLHPDFESASRQQDLAILRVNAAMDVPLQPLQAAEGAAPAPDSPALVAGWGRTGYGDSQSSADTSVLQQAWLEVTAGDACDEALGGAPDPAFHLCADDGDRSEDAPADACAGDSGGPLLVQTGEGGTEQIGITSFGPLPCGVGDPGVYARVDVGRGFVDDVLAGRVHPVDFDAVPEAAPPLRVAADPGTTPVIPGDEAVTQVIPQAIAASRAVFSRRGAEMAVLARDDRFPDALAGSALVFGRGPMLFTSPGQPLADETREELRRAVAPGAAVFVLGGTAAVPADVEDALREDGFTPVRLAGASREETAAVIGEQVVARHGEGDRPPFGTVVLVTAGDWPDAVLATQLASWWGYPVLLSPWRSLAAPAAQALRHWEVDRLLVIGGQAALSDQVVNAAMEAADVTRVTRMAGSDRIDTALAVSEFQRAELSANGQRPPDVQVVVNLRRDDAYAHVLSAAPLMAASAGTLLPVEGVRGDELRPGVQRAFCGTGGRAIAIGGTDLVGDDALRDAAETIGQQAC